MGLGGLAEREGPVDHGLDLAGLDQRPDFVAQVARNGALELDRPGTQRRAADREAPAHDLVDVELGLVAAQEGDEHEPTVVGEALELLRHVVAADHVENYVDALASGGGLDLGREVLRLVVDRLVGAEPLAGSAFLIGPSGREHAVARGLRHLDGAHADARGAALHEERLARREARAVVDIAPDGEEGFGERGRFGERPALRHRQRGHLRRDAILGVAAALHERADRIAWFMDFYGRTYGNPLARHLEARQIRRIGGHRVVSAALQDVWAVHASGGDLDQDLARLRRRHRAHDGLEHFGAAGLRDLDGAHLFRNHLCHHNGMAQFRVEFVLDQSSGKYLAEMYHPENHEELLVRTEALYPSEAAAVLGLVQLFKNAVLQFPQPGEPVRKIGKPKKKAKPARNTKKVKKAKRGKKRK